MSPPRPLALPLPAGAYEGTAEDEAADVKLNMSMVGDVQERWTFEAEELMCRSGSLKARPLVTGCEE